MVRPHTSYRTLAALILLALLAYLFISLGNWQLRRAAERTAITQAIDAGRARPPLPLSAQTSHHDLQPWRPATATGVWRNDLTVLLENRSHQGQPGYWVSTPLMMSDRDAVLVLRGWLPRYTGDTGQPIAPKVPALSGQQTISGELLERVPRLFELPGWAGGGGTQLPARLPESNGSHPVVQNLDLVALSTATGLKFLPVVLAQTAPPRAAASSTPVGQANALVYDWPEPSQDANQNRGYALQWFGFAAIAVVAWLLIAWRAVRRVRNS